MCTYNKNENQAHRELKLLYTINEKQLQCTSKSKHFCKKIVGLRKVAWDVCPNSQDAI